MKTPPSGVLEGVSVILQT